MEQQIGFLHFVSRLFVAAHLSRWAAVVLITARAIWGETILKNIVILLPLAIDDR